MPHQKETKRIRAYPTHQAVQTAGATALVGLVLDQPVRPEWVRVWAMRRVLDGGKAAEELFSLARSAT
mgnify:CR=1 FL=1